MKPIVFLPFFFISLIAGIVGGWYRMGWQIQIPNAAAMHGFLMIGGFMGGVITLERMITMNKKWWLVFPGFCAISIILGLSGHQQFMAIGQTLAAIGMLLFYLIHMQKDNSAYWYVLALGASCWIFGNIYVLMTNTIPFALPWWIGFILFTVLGERLELTRFLPVPQNSLYALYGMMFLFLLSLWLPMHGIGRWLYVLSLACIVYWFAIHDMARRSIKKQGYSRYLGIGILTAYAWLFFHVLSVLLFLDHPFGYDLYIHTFFLGFGFSMIWAHGPMILPAVLKLSFRPFHPILWVFWGIFQLSLLLRVIGTTMDINMVRQFFSVLNGCSIIAIFIIMATLVRMRYSERRLNI